MSETATGGCSVKKDVLKKFANFRGKHLFLIKLPAFKLQQGCFPVKFAKFLRTPILKNICKRLLRKYPSQTETNQINLCEI